MSGKDSAPTGNVTRVNLPSDPVWGFSNGERRTSQVLTCNEMGVAEWRSLTLATSTPASQYVTIALSPDIARKSDIPVPRDYSAEVVGLCFVIMMLLVLVGSCLRKLRVVQETLQEYSITRKKGKQE